MATSFGMKLKQYRKNNNLTQEELAAKLGTTKQSISRYESDQRSPKITKVGEIAKLLNLPLSYFLDDEESEQEDIPVALSAPDGYDKLTDEQRDLIQSLVNQYVERNK